MSFTVNTLNSRGIVSWTTTLEGLFGAKYTTTNSLAQVNADPSTCSIGWTNVEMESHVKTVEIYLVQLQTVYVVDVQRYSQRWESENYRKLEPRFSLPSGPARLVPAQVLITIAGVHRIIMTMPLPSRGRQFGSCSQLGPAGGFRYDRQTAEP